MIGLNYYPPLSTSHLSKWMENLTFGTSYQAKILTTMSISYILHPIMPLCLLYLLFPLLLLLLLCSLSNVFWRFPSWLFNTLFFCFIHMTLYVCIRTQMFLNAFILS